MTEILFVCTANQFRSPIAAGYFTRRLKETGEPGEWKVSSAGTWAVNGLTAHPVAVKAAAQLGLDLSGHRTREVTVQILSDADLIIVMERGHKEALQCEFPECRARVVLMGEFAYDCDSEIPDPAQTGFENSASVVRMMIECIDKGFAKLVSLANSQNNNRQIQLDLDTGCEDS